MVQLYTVVGTVVAAGIVAEIEVVESEAGAVEFAAAAEEFELPVEAVDNTVADFVYYNTRPFFVLFFFCLINSIRYLL